MSGMTTILFLGGWLPIFNIMPFNLLLDRFSLKLSIFVIAFIWARAALPRYRYDQLMSLGWKAFLPLSLSWLLFTVACLISFIGYLNKYDNKITFGFS